MDPGLLDALIEALERRRISPDEIAMFRLQWERLRRHDAYPCPLCFLDGEEQSLEVADLQPIRCLSCRNTFSVRPR
jgi:hypothetical protein